MTSTWTGVTGNWNVNGNWVNNPAIGGFPSNGNAGVATYDANISSGTATLNLSVTIQRLNLSGGSIDGSFNLTNNDVVTWTGGSLAGTGRTLANGGIAINANGSIVTLDTRTLRTTGSSSLTNGYLNGLNAAVLTNVAGATFSLLDDSSVNYAGGALPTLNNAGTLIKSGAGNNISGQGVGVSLINWALTNSGNIVAQRGTISFAGGYVQTAGALILTGGVVSSSSPLDIQGGYLRGTGTVYATVSNAGTIAPGFSAGRLDINNDLTQLAGSRLVMELGGYTQSTQHDFLNVTGNASLGGSLLITFINNFISTVTNGAAFTVLTAGTPVAGSFANVASGGTVASTEGYASFTVTYAASSNVRLSGLAITDTDTDGIPNWWEDAFGLNKNSAADASLDADGDGVSNLNEFLGGTDPTHAVSALRIVSVVRTNNDMRVTWTTVGGRKYRLQAGSGVSGGGFTTNNLGDIASLVTMPVGGESITNQVDVGGATNVPARYYRVKLVP